MYYLNISLMWIDYVTFFMQGWGVWQFRIALMAGKILDSGIINVNSTLVKFSVFVSHVIHKALFGKQKSLELYKESSQDSNMIPNHIDENK